MERTFVMIKPDGVQRCLVGKVVQRFEEKGFKLVGMKLMTISPELAGEHYKEHIGKPFYNSLMEYITSGPVTALVLEGKDVVSAVRTVVGKTNPLEASPGTIRGDFGIETGRNIIHASDSVPSSDREIDLFFKPEEVQGYTRIDNVWLYE
ncbi:MAG: nucleoside-diphosphate kinase [Thermoplasmata archaeon]|nr:nucleoside-diphosphate kinase [Thermoplasmata archaeon]